MKKNIKTIIGIVITLGLAYFIFRQIDFNKLIQNIQQADYVLVIIGTLPFLLAHLFLSFRLQEILKANQFKKIDIFPLYKITIMSVMLNNTLPARAGELAKAFFLVKNEKTSIGISVAAVVTERFFDLIIVVFCVVLPFFFFDFLTRFDALIEIIKDHLPGIVDYQPGKLFRIPIYILVTLVFTGITAILIFRKKYELLVSLIQRLVFWLPKEHPIFDKLRHFLADIKFFTHPNQLIKILFFSIIIWHLYALNMFLLLQAFNLHVSYVGLLFIIGMVAVWIGIPSVPGALVIYETAFAFGAMLVGIDDWNKVFSCAVILHTFQIISSSIIGFIFFIKENVSIKEIISQQQMNK